MTAADEGPHAELAMRFIQTERAKFTKDAACDVFDLAAYDLADPASPRFRSLVNQCRADLRRRNIAVLPGFVRPDCIYKIAAELAALDDKAYVSRSAHNPYFTPRDDDLGETHPRNIYARTSNGFIAYDDLPDTTILKAIFFSDLFVAFLRACVGMSTLHQFADPLTCMTVNVMTEGQTLGWHFDTPQFSITLSIEQAETGGAFEYAPNIRSVERGVQNYPDVAQVLLGQSAVVQSFVAPPGSLQIFMGRNALHRVSAVARGTRKMAIFSYDPEPGQHFHPKKSLDLFGRTGFEPFLDAKDVPPNRTP